MNPLTVAGAIHNEHAQVAGSGELTIQAHAEEIHCEVETSQTAAIHVSITDKVPPLPGHAACGVKLTLTPVEAAQLAGDLYRIARNAALDTVNPA